MVENTSTKIITPKRKNQKKNSFNENLLLKERHKVKNLFADF